MGHSMTEETAGEVDDEGADAWSRLRSMKRRFFVFALGGVVGFPVLALAVRHANAGVSSMAIAGVETILKKRGKTIAATAIATYMDRGLC